MGVNPEDVEYYKNKQKDINVKTIKKVVEAKARKKRLLMKKMSKAKKRAATIMENEDLGSREKAKEIERLYKKASQTKKRGNATNTRVQKRRLKGKKTRSQ